MDFADSNDSPQAFQMEIIADYAYIYDNLWIDTSTISIYSFAEYYPTYRPETSWPQNLIGQRTSHFTLTFQQSRDVYTSSWCVKALNTVIGRIGGYTALIWMVITSLISGYESHKFQNSLLNSLYHCTEEGPDATPSDTESKSKHTLKKTINAKNRFKYFYYEAFLTWLASMLCLCCKNREWYKRRMDRQQLFNDAQKRLAREINLHTILNTVRMTDFMASLMRL